MIIYLRVIPGLCVAVEEQRRPELRAKPVSMGGLPHERGMVHEANLKAQEAGVRAGMTLSQAHQQCPDGIFLTPDLPTYDAVWQQVCDVLRMHTPLVEPLEMGEVVCDVSGCERQWDGDWDMARQIAWDVLSTTGIASWLGVASNRLVAQLASMSVGGDGITIVPKGQEARFLADLPVNFLLSAATEGGATSGVWLSAGEADRVTLTFQVLGLRTIGQFAALPVSSVKQRFGVTGERLHRFARGVDSRKVIPTPAKPSVSALFECDEGTWEEAMEAIHRLAETCATELQQRRVAGRLVEIRIASRQLSSRKSEVGSRKSKASRKSEVGSRKLEVESRKAEVGSQPATVVEGLTVPYRIHSMLPQPSLESRVLTPGKSSTVMEDRGTGEDVRAVREGRDEEDYRTGPKIFRPPAKSARADCHASWDREVSVIKTSATVRTPIDTANALIERAQKMLVDAGHEAFGLRQEGYEARHEENRGAGIWGYGEYEDAGIQAIELRVSEFEAPSQLSFEEFNRIDQTGGLSGMDAGRLKALTQQEEVLIARHGETPFRHVVEVDPVNVLAERRFRWEEGIWGRQ